MGFRVKVSGLGFRVLDCLGNFLIERALYLRLQEAKVTSGRGLRSRFSLVSRVRDFRFRVQGLGFTVVQKENRRASKTSVLSPIVPIPG